MKKVICLLLTVLMIFSCVGCQAPAAPSDDVSSTQNNDSGGVSSTQNSSSDDASSTQNNNNAPSDLPQPEESSIPSSEVLEVDKGESDVEITLPASFIEAAGGQVDFNNTEDGVTATQNADNSVTLKMTKAKHAELLNYYKESIQTTLNELCNNENFASLERADFNDDFTQINFFVNKAVFEKSLDAMAGLSVYMAAAIYQMLDGKTSDTIRCEVVFKDASTNDVIQSAVYPDDLNKNRK